MPQKNNLALKPESKQEIDASMEIWNNPHKPGFMFQQYRSIDEAKVSPYEVLAILKNADGSPLANSIYFDELRQMSSEWQIEADRYLVPLAIQAAVEKKRLPVAVNIHLATLFDDGFLDVMRLLIQKMGIEQKNVLFEIVEPHVPTDEQIKKLKDISARTNPESGFVLIIDDHNFETGHDRITLLAPFCDMVKIDMDQAPDGFQFLRKNYPHLSIVLERVTFNDREKVFTLYPGVAVQGI